MQIINFVPGLCHQRLHGADEGLGVRLPRLSLWNMFYLIMCSCDVKENVLTPNLYLPCRTSKSHPEGIFFINHCTAAWRWCILWYAADFV